MYRIIVRDSKTISSASYYPEDKTLRIMFHTGAVYAYYDVPEEAWARFANARSKGEHHAEYIRDRYRCERV